MKRPALILSLTLAAATPAAADCEHFKWSVANAQKAFEKTDPLSSPADAAVVGKGYAVKLTKDLSLPNKPERDPKPGTYAAVIAVNKLDAGLYQVTLSQDAWIDISQDDKGVKSSDFSGQHDCPSIRKSVRFKLAAGAATVEISNAQAEALNFAIEPAP